MYLVSTCYKCNKPIDKLKPHFVEDTIKGVHLECWNCRFKPFCPKCLSSYMVKSGIMKRKKFTRQRFKCQNKNCNHIKLGDRI